MHLLAIHAYARRCADAQADPLALNGHHENADLFANYDLFTDTPTKH
jgi:hypothetical protein